MLVEVGTEYDEGQFSGRTNFAESKFFYQKYKVQAKKVFSWLNQG